MSETLMNLLNTRTLEGALIELMIYAMFFIVAILLVKLITDSKTSNLSHFFKDLINNDRKINVNQFYASSRGVEIEMNMLDKFHLQYIERTSIKAIIPFMNVGVLIAILLTCFLACMTVLLPVVGNIITATILSAILSSIPLMLLDLRGKMMSERARRDLYTYISTLKSWANMKTDMLFIFSKTAEGSTGPLATHTRQLVVQIKSGLSPQVALELMRLKVNNHYFDTFILNVSQAFENQGDIVALLSKLEKEAFRLEKAFNDRKIRTLLDRALVFGFMIVTVLIAVYMLVSNVAVRATFVDSVPGQIVLAVSSTLFAIGVVMLFRITKFEH